MKSSRRLTLIVCLLLCGPEIGCSEAQTEGVAAAEGSEADLSGGQDDGAETETPVNDTRNPSDTETETDNNLDGSSDISPDSSDDTDISGSADTTGDVIIEEDIAPEDAVDSGVGVADTKEEDVGIPDAVDTAEGTEDATTEDDSADSGEEDTTACTPGETLCEGASQSICDENGQWLAAESCPEGQICIADVCASLCDNLSNTINNEGCLFTAISTSNPSLSDAFQDDFAVVVSNRQLHPNGTVTIRKGDTVMVEEPIASGETLTLTLPMVQALSGKSSGSILEPDAAYVIESTVPITALQFSPLHFELDELGSLTNDASLLLPHHGLSGNYLMSGFPAWGKVFTWRSPFIAFSATVDATSITVTASTNIAGGPGVNAMAAGEQQTFTLDAGDVIQLLVALPEDEALTETSCPGFFSDFGFPDIYCLDPELDLSGTTLSASAPIAVFSGHSCLQLPYFANACDHAEEQLLPLEAWGDDHYLTAPMRPDGAGAMEVTYRIQAKDDETTVEFPFSADPVVLNSGDAISVPTDLDFHLLTGKPVLITQAMHGAYGVDPPTINAAGEPLSDPAITTVVPQRQARSEYFFLVPDTYESDWLNVVAFTDAQILLDGTPVTEWEPITDSVYSVAKIPVGPGNHRIWSETGQAFTINVYGFARHTSYMYPGGLNLMP